MTEYLDESSPSQEERSPRVLHRLLDWGVRDVLQGVDVQLHVGLLQLLPGLLVGPGHVGVVKLLVVAPERALLGGCGHPALGEGQEVNKKTEY